MAWAARRTHNAADFAIANRRLGPWLVTLSYAATGVNAWMLMTVAAAAFLWGLSAAWIWAAVVLGCIVNMWFVAPRLRAASIGSGGITVIHLLGVDAGDRLQPLVVRSAVFIMMLTLALQIAAILQFAGVMLADVGLSTTNVLILSLAVMTATVFAGGMRAASMIDTMQSVVVIAVALFLPLPALIAAGGLTELKMAFTTIGPEAMNWFDGKSGVAAIAFAAGVVGLGLAMCGQPHERPDAALSEAQVRSDFRRALAELPPEQRDVFVLYEESGLTLEEIGRITGVAMETAKSRLRYAVGKLRTALRQHRPRQLEPSVQS